MSNDSSSLPVSGTVFSRCSSAVMTNSYPPRAPTSRNRPLRGARAALHAVGPPALEGAIDEEQDDRSSNRADDAGHLDGAVFDVGTEERVARALSGAALLS